MSITITAICGDKSVSIKIQRPSFENVRKAYEDININLDEEKAEEVLKARGITKKEDIDLYKRPIARYMKVGGGAYKQFLNNMPTYRNTCTLRVSYALNYSCIPINSMKHQIPDRAYKGDDKHTYYLGVFDMIELLKSNWKELSWNKCTYNQVKNSIEKGNSEDFYKAMNSKEENREFFKELEKIKRKGIVAMIGTGGLRHATLWEVDNFVDVKLGTGDNYLVLKVIS